MLNTKTKPTVKQTQPTKPTAEKTAEPEATVTVRTHENLDVTPEEKRRAVAAQQLASAEEQRIASQMRGLELLMKKEEQALAQRMAYAGKMRAQGLAKNDQKLLDQAEKLERQALDYYLKRVKQFENASVKSSEASMKLQQKQTRSTKSSSAYRSSRSSSRSRR